MNRFLVLAAGFLARLCGTVARLYADWLFRKLVDGVEAGADFFSDAVEFCQALLVELAEQLGGRPTATRYAPAVRGWSQPLFDE